MSLMKLDIHRHLFIQWYKTRHSKCNGKPTKGYSARLFRTRKWLKLGNFQHNDRFCIYERVRIQIIIISLFNLTNSEEDLLLNSDYGGTLRTYGYGHHLTIVSIYLTISRHDWNPLGLKSLTIWNENNVTISLKLILFHWRITSNLVYGVSLLFVGRIFIVHYPGLCIIRLLPNKLEQISVKTSLGGCVYYVGSSLMSQVRQKMQLTKLILSCIHFSAITCISAGCQQTPLIWSLLNSTAISSNPPSNITALFGLIFILQKQSKCQKNYSSLKLRVRRFKHLQKKQILIML